jgi:hypothetical protein
MQSRISALSEAQARLAAAAEAEATFREFALANQSEIANAEGGALMVRIAGLCNSEYNQYVVAFGDLLKKAQLLDDYTLMNWDAIQTAAGRPVGAYQQLLAETDGAGNIYNTALSAHQSCIAAAAGTDPELARVLGEAQSEVGRR